MMAMTVNPYAQLPQTAFWRSAIAEKNLLQIEELWQPKHKISTTHRVATVGSCFAQHISRALIKNGFSWYDGEPAPPMLNDEFKKAFNYGVFSFRSGNIYTPTLLLQWLHWAFELTSPSTEIWQFEGGRYIDPFRPRIEPDGFSSIDELFKSRKQTLAAIRKTISEVDFFVFTLGLTEAWVNTDQGYVYPMCPGTVAGEFDKTAHAFVNFSYVETQRALSEAVDLMRSVNPNIKVILTVSPVPLTATASGEHVLPATIYSKSVLRAVAGEAASGFDYIDYFPSFEIISSFPYRGAFYMPNMRSVAPQGVDHVMGLFFKANGGDQVLHSDATTEEVPRKITLSEEIDEEVCEEVLLDAFGR